MNGLVIAITRGAKKIRTGMDGRGKRGCRLQTDCWIAIQDSVQLKGIFLIYYFSSISHFPFFVSALRNEQRQPDESNGQVELRKMPVYRKGGGEKLGKSVDLT